MTQLARVPVSDAQINRVVSVFYARVRVHPVLGPIFAAHVKDWTTHEARIMAFWRNVLLYQKGYNGNPMQVHLAAGNVEPKHFEPWLALFDDVLLEEVPRHLAQPWSALAHRIGRGLRFGLNPDPTLLMP